MDNMNLAYLMAGASSVGLLWNQIRSFIQRFSSYFIVNVELTGNSADLFMRFAWKNYKSTKYGTRRFYALHKYIRPKSYTGYVPFEQTGKIMTFFKGWKPLFVSTNQEKNSSGGTNITYVRGMFDIEEILIEAAHLYNDDRHNANKDNSRYYVRKVFGTSLKKRGYDGESKSDAPETIASNNDLDEGRPIGFNLSDLGAPVSKIPFSDLSYPKHIEDFKSEIIRWKKSEEWHRSKGLRWRMGAGMYGPPGTGKTSFARAIGQELDMPIHIYDLTTMSNQDLVNAWRNSLNASPCIVLFEDIDRIFDKDKNIKSTGDNPSVTLDCLLNCINGVEPADGILVLVTANDMSKLDPALGVPEGDGKSTRPGRLDRGVYFGALEKEQRLKIANRILSDCPQFIEATVKAGDGETGAQFEKRCGDIAIEDYWGKPKIFTAKAV